MNFASSHGYDRKKLEALGRPGTELQTKCWVVQVSNEKNAPWLFIVSGS